MLSCECAYVHVYARDRRRRGANRSRGFHEPQLHKLRQTLVRSTRLRLVRETRRINTKMMARVNVMFQLCLAFAMVTCTLHRVSVDVITPIYSPDTRTGARLPCSWRNRRARTRGTYQHGQINNFSHSLFPTLISVRTKILFGTEEIQKSIQTFHFCEIKTGNVEG